MYFERRRNPSWWRRQDFDDKMTGVVSSVYCLADLGDDYVSCIYIFSVEYHGDISWAVTRAFNSYYADGRIRIKTNWMRLRRRRLKREDWQRTIHCLRNGRREKNHHEEE
jgi:hypothetical protein